MMYTALAALILTVITSMQLKADINSIEKEFTPMWKVEQTYISAVYYPKTQQLNVCISGKKGTKITYKEIQVSGVDSEGNNVPISKDSNSETLVGIGSATTTFNALYKIDGKQLLKFIKIEWQGQSKNLPLSAKL